MLSCDLSLEPYSIFKSSFDIFLGWALKLNNPNNSFSPPPRLPLSLYLQINVATISPFPTSYKPLSTLLPHDPSWAFFSYSCDHYFSSGISFSPELSQLLPNWSCCLWPLLFQSTEVLYDLSKVVFFFFFKYKSGHVTCWFQILQQTFPCGQWRNHHFHMLAGEIPHNLTSDSFSGFITHATWSHLSSEHTADNSFHLGLGYPPLQRPVLTTPGLSPQHFMFKLFIGN